MCQHFCTVFHSYIYYQKIWLKYSLSASVLSVKTILSEIRSLTIRHTIYVWHIHMAYLTCNSHKCTSRWRNLRVYLVILWVSLMRILSVLQVVLKLQVLQDTHSTSEHTMKSKVQMITNHLSNELYGKTKISIAC